MPTTNGVDGTQKTNAAWAFVKEQWNRFVHWLGWKTNKVEDGDVKKQMPSVESQPKTSEDRANLFLASSVKEEKNVPVTMKTTVDAESSSDTMLGGGKSGRTQQSTSHSQEETIEVNPKNLASQPSHGGTLEKDSASLMATGLHFEKLLEDEVVYPDSLEVSTKTTSDPTFIPDTVIPVQPITDYQRHASSDGVVGEKNIADQQAEKKQFFVEMKEAEEDKKIFDESDFAKRKDELMEKMERRNQDMHAAGKKRAERQEQLRRAAIPTDFKHVGYKNIGQKKKEGLGDKTQEAINQRAKADQDKKLKGTISAHEEQLWLCVQKIRELNRKKDTSLTENDVARLYKENIRSFAQPGNEIDIPEQVKHTDPLKQKRLSPQARDKHANEVVGIILERYREELLDQIPKRDVRHEHQEQLWMCIRDIRRTNKTGKTNLTDNQVVEAYVSNIDNIEVASQRKVVAKHGHKSNKQQNSAVALQECVKEAVRVVKSSFE